MFFRQRNPWFPLLAVCLGMPLYAGIIDDALLSFPANTEYLEYDNLSSLRTLPKYSTLRQEFSGKSLDEARIVLAQLGIEESQVQEIVITSTTNVFEGLIAGQFSAESVSKNPKSRRYAARLLDAQVFCMGRETCVVFLEDSLAAFGSFAQLKNMLLTRQGAHVRLSSNSDAVRLLNATDRNAPVRGMLFGEQLRAAISNAFRDWSGLKADSASLTGTISGLGYTVTFDGKAHVSAAVECASRSAATLLSQTFSGVAALQSLAAPMLSNDVRFQNVRVSSSGNMMYFRADTAIPDKTASR